MNALHVIIRRFAPTGLLIAILLLGACATAPWEGFPSPSASDLVFPPAPMPARVAYVQSIRTHEDIFQTGGGFAGIKRLLAGPKDSRIARPYAVAIHPAGGLLVTDPGRMGVHFYQWSARKYTFIGDGLEGGLTSPVGVVALPDGDILVSDSRRSVVERFSVDGQWKGTFAKDLGRPAGLALDSQRSRLYLVDVTNHRIDLRDLQGRRLTTWGGRGSNPGQFNFPTHVAVSPNGNVAVTDAMNFRVQLFSPEGDFIGAYGELGNARGQFSKPKGVAVDEMGQVIVIEGLYDALQFFRADGELLLSIGEPGAAPAQFWLPAGLAYDSAQRLLFVADSYNQRVQVFRLLETESPDVPGEEAAQP